MSKKNGYGYINFANRKHRTVQPYLRRWNGGARVWVVGRFPTSIINHMSTPGYANIPFTKDILFLYTGSHVNPWQRRCFSTDLFANPLGQKPPCHNSRVHKQHKGLFWPRDITKSHLLADLQIDHRPPVFEHACRCAPRRVLSTSE